MAAEVELDPGVRLRADFRAAMGQVAAPVSIVTTYDADGPHGATVSAFASLSMEPPMLLVSLQDTSRLLTRLRVGSPVAVNVLAADQHGLATRFATRSDERFADLAWTLVEGAPVLAGTHARVSLTVARLVEAGDHVLVLGDVLDAVCGDAGAPLTYHRRTFGTHLAH